MDPTNTVIKRIGEWKAKELEGFARQRELAELVVRSFYDAKVKIRSSPYATHCFDGRVLVFSDQTGGLKEEHVVAIDEYGRIWFDAVSVGTLEATFEHLLEGLNRAYLKASHSFFAIHKVRQEADEWSRK